MLKGGSRFDRVFRASRLYESADVSRETAMTPMKRCTRGHQGGVRASAEYRDAKCPGELPVEVASLEWDRSAFFRREKYVREGSRGSDRHSHPATDAGRG